MPDRLTAIAAPLLWVRVQALRADKQHQLILTLPLFHAHLKLALLARAGALADALVVAAPLPQTHRAKTATYFLHWVIISVLFHLVALRKSDVT